MIRRLFRRRKATKVFIEVHIPKTLSVEDTKALAERVRLEMLREQRRNGTTGIR